MVIDRPLWTRIFADDAVICGGKPGEVEVCPGEERKEGRKASPDGWTEKKAGAAWQEDLRLEKKTETRTQRTERDGEG